ncbi:PRC-barrel domain-containing protein [Thioclava pacifica]|uniref:PRC-barrel domain-containing protein n=1 Tax=Thioclava pacifica DSM 10166 TaxID=1353537 RepID=A0A074J8R5_9RHOB|nr:PRC-barrel domain-containing protein [Thioclava pacifica]KEO52954.1 hypothetical protein TP2_08425 [Thioclava pacifica DSM 10166]
MKNLITTTAIGLMLALPAAAETKTDVQVTSPTDSAQVTVEQGSANDTFFKAIPHSISASGMIGKRVYVSETAMDPSKAVKAADQNWEDIGEVSDVVIGMDGNVDAVLVDVGGFLGIGEKTVAISMGSLRLIPDGDTENAYFVVVKGDKAMLDQAPAYEGDMQTSWADVSETEAMKVNNSAEAAMHKAGDAAKASAAAAGQAMDNAAEATKQAASDAADKTKAMAKDAAQSTKQAANEAGQAIDEAADKAGAATKEAAAKTGSAIDDAVDSTAAAVGQVGQASAEDGQQVDIASVDPDVLRGEGVYGPNNDKVGDVSALVTGSDGSVQGVVIDVGGFLGIGAKPVEIDTNQLTVLQDNHSITVHTGLTEEQLKTMPKYEG